MATHHTPRPTTTQDNHFVKFNNFDDLIDYLNQHDYYDDLAGNDDNRSDNNATSNNGSCGHDCCLNGTCNCPACFVLCPTCGNNNNDDDDDDPAG